jgi:hypothetical protein
MSLLRSIVTPYYNSKTKNGAFNVRVLTSSFYSTLASSKREAGVERINLDPNHVKGFTDGDGSFVVTLRPKLKAKWSTQVSYAINLHVKDKAFLELIQAYFGWCRLYFS